MPEGQEGPRGNPDKKPDNKPSLRNRLRGLFKPKNSNPSNRPPTLEEQLRASGMKTAEPRLTTAQQARKNRAEELKSQREELARVREENRVKPSWGDIEEITYREMIAKGEPEKAEKYRSFILGTIEKEKKGKE